MRIHKHPPYIGPPSVAERPTGHRADIRELTHLLVLQSTTGLRVPVALPGGRGARWPGAASGDAIEPCSRRRRGVAILRVPERRSSGRELPRHLVQLRGGVSLHQRGRGWYVFE